MKFLKARAKRRKPWTLREDEAIRALVGRFGTKQWTTVADKLYTEFQIGGRTGKQCRERWHNHLNAGINKQPWSLEEEQTLFQVQSRVGNKWAIISKRIPGRTDNAIKNHFYSTLRKEFRKQFGFEPTKEQLTSQLQPLAARVLETLVDKENYLWGSTTDLGELFIAGHQIPLPLIAEYEHSLEEEFPVEFSWNSHSQNSAEVFMMPFSPIDT